MGDLKWVVGEGERGGAVLTFDGQKVGEAYRPAGSAHWYWLAENQAVGVPKKASALRRSAPLSKSRAEAMRECQEYVHQCLGLPVPEPGCAFCGGLRLVAPQPNVTIRLAALRVRGLQEDAREGRNDGNHAATQTAVNALLDAVLGPITVATDNDAAEADARRKKAQGPRPVLPGRPRRPSGQLRPPAPRKPRS